jgi:hypothetical protein
MTGRWTLGVFFACFMDQYQVIIDTLGFVKVALNSAEHRGAFIQPA